MKTLRTVEPNWTAKDENEEKKTCVKSPWEGIGKMRKLYIKYKERNKRKETMGNCQQSEYGRERGADGVTDRVGDKQTDGRKDRKSDAVMHSRVDRYRVRCTRLDCSDGNIWPDNLIVVPSRFNLFLRSNEKRKDRHPFKSIQPLSSYITAPIKSEESSHKIPKQQLKGGPKRT